MKTFTTALVAAALLLTGIAPPAYAAKPMHPSVERLDLDGDFVLFLNTAGIEERFLEVFEQLAEIGAEASMSSAETEMGLAIIEAAVKWSGLLSLKSFAMSSAPVDDDLTRVVSVIEHDENDADKALWRIIGSEPRALKGIQYAPADAVYVANTTANLNEAWKVINEGVEEIGGDQATAAFNQQLFMAQIMIGTNISVITESIDADILVSIQLSEERTVEFPAEQLSIPEPSLLIGFGVNNAVVKDLLLQKLQLAGMPIAKSTHETTELNTIQLPPDVAPIPLSPTIAMTDDYLLIGSTVDAVKSALDARAKSDGVVATDDYKRLLKDAPAEVSAIEYMAPRFMEVYMETLSEAIGEDSETELLLEFMDEAMGEMYSGAFALNTAKGVYSRALMNCGGMKPTEMIAASYTAILAAVAIPLMTGNQDRAMATEAQAGCATISTALKLHEVDKGTIVGVTSPSDLSGLRPGDLDGTYFKDDSYSIVVVDDQNYSIVAKGEGKAADIMVVMQVEKGEVIWITP